MAERIYVLDDPELRPMLDLTAVIESEISAELPGGLVVATAQRCTTGSQPALATRADDIDAALIDAGWLIPAHDGTMPMVDAADVAVELGCEVQAARRYLRTGAIASVVESHRVRGRRRLARWDDVQAYKASRDGWTTTAELAQVAGRTLRGVTDYLARAGVLSEIRGGVRMLAPEAAQLVLAYFEEQGRLAERSMPLSQAKVQLGVPLVVIAHMIATAKLVEDTRNAAGFRMVTRTSVAAVGAWRTPGRCAVA